GVPCAPREARSRAFGVAIGGSWPESQAVGDVARGLKRRNRILAARTDKVWSRHRPLVDGGFPFLKLLERRRRIVRSDCRCSMLQGLTSFSRNRRPIARGRCLKTSAASSGLQMQRGGELRCERAL